MKILNTKFKDLKIIKHKSYKDKKRIFKSHTQPKEIK